MRKFIRSGHDTYTGVIPAMIIGIIQVRRLVDIARCHLDILLPHVHHRHHNLGSQSLVQPVLCFRSEMDLVEVNIYSDWAYNRHFLSHRYRGL